MHHSTVTPRRDWSRLALPFLACLLGALPLHGVRAQDLVTYVGGAGSERFVGALALSDGTYLVCGQADSLDWVPAGTPVTTLSATGITSSSAGKIGILVQFSADLSTILRVLHFPAGTVEDITRIRSTEVPGQPTGTLFISGQRAVADGTQDGYYLARLNNNFVSGTPTGLTWVYNVVCPDRGTGDSLYKTTQIWDARNDGLVVFGFGTDNSSTASGLRVLDATGQLTTISGWPLNVGGFSELRLAVGGLRSQTQDDLDRIVPDGNGGVRMGTYPDDVFAATPAGGSRGYTGYSNASSSYAVGQIAIDRRNNHLYFGFNVQSTLPSGLPDFEPAIVGLTDSSALKWWSRLYTEMFVADGVSRSVNSAGNWTASNSGLANKHVRALAVDPTTPSTVYSGTYNGVYKTTDTGANWTQAGAALAGVRITALAVHPTSTSTVYAGTPVGLYKSTDSGGNWTLSSTGLTSNYVTTIAVDPVTPSTLYVGTSGGGVFKSTNNGTNWADSNGGLTGSPLYAYALAVHPTTPSIVYRAGHGGVYKSVDSGGNWTLVTTGINSADLTSYALAIHPATPTTVYLGTRGGVYRSTNSGGNWTGVGSWVVYDSYQSKNVTINGAVRSLAIDKQTPYTVYAGYGYRGCRKSTDGTTWTPANNGLASTPNTTQEMGMMVYALAVDPTSAGKVWLGSMGLPRNSIPDQYIDSVAVDYSQPAGNGTIGVVARSHGNDFSNLWDGDSIPSANNPANPGYSFHNKYTGTNGNAHYSWVGKFGDASGVLLYASRLAEYGDVGSLSTSTLGGSPYTDPNLDAWPSHNSGNAELNTTKTEATTPAFDASGQLFVTAKGRATVTTLNAYQRHPNQDRRTSVTSGTSSTTFVSNGLQGRDLVTPGVSVVRFTSGANNGQERLVTAFHPPTGTVTLNASLTATPAAGDTFRLWEGKGSWNWFVRGFTSNFTSLTYSSALTGQWSLGTGVGGDNTVFGQALPVMNGVLVVGYHQSANGTAKGNAIPTINVPAYGSAAPQNETAFLARLVVANRPTVYVEATSPEFAEGSATPAVFTFTRTGGDTSQPLTVQYSVGGSASAGTDYTPAPGGNITFSANSTTATLSLNATDDGSAESGENVSIALLPSALYRAGSFSSASASLIDNDTNGSIAVNSTAATVNEQGGQVVLSVSRSGGNLGAVGISYATQNGSATAGADYTAISGTLSWANGEVGTKAVTIPVTYDPYSEGSETFSLVLSSPTGGASLGSNTTAISLTDYFVPGTLQFTTSNVITTEAGQTVNLLVTRTGGATGPASITFATMSGNAVAGTDFVPASGTLSWGHEESTTRTLAVALNDNTTVQGNRNFFVLLSAATGAGLGTPNQVTVTLQDDDTAGGIEFSPANYAVDESGGNATLTVVRTGGSSGAVSVSYTSGTGTATPGADYTAVSGNLSWAGGDSAPKTFTIPILSDTTAEGAETVPVTLSAPTGGAVLGSRTSATLAINDNDGAGVTWANTSGDRLWNLTSVNWTGAHTVFQSTDAVTFGATGSGNVTIQASGVASATVTVNASVNYTFTGGVLTNGALVKSGTGSVYFDLYNASHTFAGGTVINSGAVYYRANAAALPGNGTALQFGSGPIQLNGGRFGFNVATNDLYLSNPFSVTAAGGTLDFGRITGNPNTVFTGDFQIGGPLSLDAGSGGGTGGPLGTHGISGGVVVQQSASATTAIRRVNNNGNQGFVLAGPITDGGGSAANPLRLQNNVGSTFVIQGLANTYAGGTVVESRTSALADPSVTTSGYVEVTANSSLGSGNVDIQARGYLRLRGQNNLKPAASVSIAATGALYVDTGVNVNVSGLTLNGTAQAPGLYSASNAPGYLYGGGTVYVLPPLVSLSVADADAGPVGNNGTFVVSRTGSTAQALLVNLSVTGTASAGSDYTAIAPTVTIPAGNSSATITVTPLTTPTVPKTVAVTVQGGNYAVDPSASGEVILGDASLAGMLSFSSVATVEESAGTATVAVRRAGGKAGAVSVQFTTSGGSASAGADYTSASGNLSWANGEDGIKTFVVSVTEDFAQEVAETIGVTLGSPTGGLILPSPATAYIALLDNDGRDLTWTNGAANGQWNTAAANWSGPSSTYRNGDDVLFAGAGLGNVTLSADVYPATTSFANPNGTYTVSGNRIRHGNLLKTGAGTVIFNGYGTSFDFAGGTVVSGGTLTYRINSGTLPPNNSTFTFGTGSVTIDGGRFSFSTSTNDYYFASPILVTAAGGTLDYARVTGNPNTVFSGPLSLGGALALDSGSGGGGGGAFGSHAISGAVTLAQSAPGALALRRINNYANQGMVIAGNITDGAGSAANPLRLLNDVLYNLVIQGAANTYAGGTVIESRGAALADPSVTTHGYVDVMSNSSLGTGNVSVATQAYLRLRGSNALSANASVAIDDGGAIYLDATANITVARLILGTTAYGTGTFNATTAAGYLYGAGRINVVSPNNPPVANDDSTSVNEDGTVLIDVRANDSDTENASFTIQSVTSPAHGTAAIEGGLIRYTPAANYNGPDSFGYTITDGEFTDSATVLVTVNSINDLPVANDDAASLNEGGTVLIDVLANDTDADDTLGIGGVGAASGGTVAIEAGKIRYTPNAGFYGSDSFTYTATDGAASDGATVSVTVNNTATAMNLSGFGLTGSNIGSGSAGSSRVLADGRWETNGSGSGLLSTADSFHFESQSVTGPFQVVVRVESLASNGATPRAGVMIRESTAAGARMVWVGLTPSSGVRYGTRNATNGNATETTVASPALTLPNAWVMLERRGTTLKVAVSPDDTTYTEVANVTMSALGTSLEAGVFSSSGTTGVNARAVVSDFAITALPNRLLNWTNGSGDRLWNISSVNWAGDATTFQAGDEVTFNGTALGNVTMTSGVAPSLTRFSQASGNYSLNGSFITGGSLVHSGTGNTTFDGYTASHTFPGGTTVSAGALRFRINGTPLPGNGTSVSFGNGTISISGGGRFGFNVNANDLVLANNITVSGTGGTLDFARTAGNPNTVFAGAFTLGAPLALDANSGGGPGGTYGCHAISGNVTLVQSASATLALRRVNGHANQNFVLIGSVSDGSGSAGNPLRLQNNVSGTFLFNGTANTYAGGTTIEGRTSALANPSITTNGYVEVSSGSSLGSGNVTVDNKGYLRFRAAANIASTAALVIATGGGVYVDSGVTVTVSTLTLGGTTHTSGTFNSSNASGFVYGAGQIQVVP